MEIKNLKIENLEIENFEMENLEIENFDIENFEIVDIKIVCFKDSEFEDFEFEFEKDGHWLKQDLVKQKSIDDLQRTITKYKKAAKILNLQWGRG